MAQTGTAVALTRPGGRPRADLHVAHVIHSLEEGGAEALLVELAGVALTAGMRLSVLSLMPIRVRRYADALADLGVDVADLGLASRWDPRALSRGPARIRGWNVDLIHTHLKHADIIGSVAARRLRVPLVSTLHVIEDRPSPLGRGKAELAAIARRSTAARTIAVSDAQRRWYLDSLRVPPSGVVTLNNGVRQPRRYRPDERAARRAAVGAGEDTVLAVAVGVLRPQKGHADLVAAVAGLSADLPLRVVVAGDGPERDRLARLAGGLGDRFRFLGWVDDVPALLDAADFVVHPSTADALPTALLEAAAAARPVVATRVGGVPEIVSAETGVLVDAGDVAALSAGIARLAGDVALRLRLGEAARQRFDLEFGAEAWAARLRELYDEVLDEHARSAGMPV